LEEKETSQKNEYILEIKGVSKAFGGTQALDNVDLFVKKGEVHALLGENGAGKSTLMKIVMGLIKADSGQLHFEGKPLSSNGPAFALQQGISMIHQELNVEPYLTVAENIFLRREDSYKNSPFLNKNLTNKNAQEILDRFELKVSAKTPMIKLTVAQMQMIEIIKAVTYNARLIIMDEPTSSLDSEETVRLFKTINDLKQKGVSIIYISHRLEEIFSICDVVSIFRDGKYIATEPIGNITRDNLIALMVGRKLDSLFPKKDVPIGDVVFKVENFSGEKFKDINFEVRRGEILGFSGLVGSGRSETMRAIFGLDKKESGKVFYEGKEWVINSPIQAIKYGLAMVSEDRKEYGLVLKRSIKENISLPNLRKLQKGILLNKKREKRDVGETSKRLNVKASSLEAAADALSGGNQQKVVLSKWIMSMPKVLILDEPTRGIDVGSKSEIHRMISEFAGEGMAIILISSELPEILGMSDRILVYSEGKINGEVMREEILNKSVGQEEILAIAFGEKRKQEVQ
jgi:ABC-type sugar transport system, ATPase component